MKTRTISLLFTAFVFLAICTCTFADKLYGTIKYKDGSKAGGEIGIATSWNSKKAYPKNGSYELDFGGKVGRKISVYVKGNKVGTVYVGGNTRFDITVP